MTVETPSATNPAVMSAGSVASAAARPLMCSFAIEYAGWRRVLTAHAAVNTAGPITPAAARRRLPEERVAEPRPLPRDRPLASAVRSSRAVTTTAS